MIFSLLDSLPSQSEYEYPASEYEYPANEYDPQEPAPTNSEPLVSSSSCTFNSSKQYTARNLIQYNPIACTLRDLIGTNDLVIGNAASLIENANGVPDSALLLNRGYLSLPYIYEFGSAGFTFSCWFKLLTKIPQASIFVFQDTTQNSGVELFLNTAISTWKLQYWNKGLKAVIDLSTGVGLNTWKHVAFIYSLKDKKAKVFFNWTNVGSFTFSATFSANENFIGRGTKSNNLIHAIYDDIRVYGEDLFTWTEVEDESKFEQPFIVV